MGIRRSARPPIGGASSRRLAAAGWFVLLLFGGLSLDAHAFECSRVSESNDTTLVWQERRIEWVLDRSVLQNAENGAAAEADVRAAFDTWSNASCSDFTFAYNGLVDGARAEFNDSGPNMNVVVWIEVGWPFDDGALAVTTSAFLVGSGRLLDADIAINGERFPWTRVDATCLPRTRTQDIQNTLTHEVGHVLGLDHPPESALFERTTMFAQAPACETRKRTLAQDDVDGICFIYPSATETGRCPGRLDPPPTDDDGGGCTHTTASSNGTGSGPWSLVAVALWLMARRRPFDRLVRERRPR